MTISVRLSVIMIADKQSQLRSNHCNKYKHYGNYLSRNTGVFIEIYLNIAMGWCAKNHKSEA